MFVHEGRGPTSAVTPARRQETPLIEAAASPADPGAVLPDWEPDGGPHGRRRPWVAGRIGLWVEFVAAAAAGLATMVALGGNPYVVLSALVIWSISAYHRGFTVTSPSRPQVRALLHSAAIALAAVSVAVGVGMVHSSSVPESVLSVGAATLVAAAARVLRGQLRGPARTIIVGDRIAVTSLAARWLTSRRVDVVACCIVEPDLSDDEQPLSIMGVPCFSGLGEVRNAVQRHGVDSVIVTPGPGFTAPDFRELSWSLERAGTTLGVVGVLDHSAPHRLSPGRLDGTTVVDVSPPRQTVMVRTVKSAIDRLAAALMLVALSPLLGAMWLAVRLDSRGPGFFRQQRVGTDGRLFTMWKMRTMHTDAEARKAALQQENEGAGLLFKMQDDPRITRVGKLLRRSSLDELPQLINVVRGEMSLIGPRPALPDEVAQYDSTTRRRLAVRPGLTGLWQVSGRSDLPWDKAIALDNFYVDNWRLSDDLLIAAQTVRAVARARGAY